MNAKKFVGGLFLVALPLTAIFMIINIVVEGSSAMIAKLFLSGLEACIWSAFGLIGTKAYKVKPFAVFRVGVICVAIITGILLIWAPNLSINFWGIKQTCLTILFYCIFIAWMLGINNAESSVKIMKWVSATALTFSMVLGVISIYMVSAIDSTFLKFAICIGIVSIATMFGTIVLNKINVGTENQKIEENV